MAKSGLSSNQLLVLLLISTFCVVRSLPANDVGSLERRHDPLEDIIHTEENGDGFGSPVYEYQLTVYPEEYLGATQDKVSTTTARVPKQSMSPVVPTMGSWPWQKPQTTTTVAPTTTKKEVLHDEHVAGVWPTHSPILQQPHPEVVEQYHVLHPNGTAEYKLVLSNGLTNYKKIYNKMGPDGKVVTVQEGFDSIPLPSDDPRSQDFLTQFYIADENGNNVYRAEKKKSTPQLPEYLDYKSQVGRFQ